jgi:hypothetical protein
VRGRAGPFVWHCELSRFPAILPAPKYGLIQNRAGERLIKQAFVNVVAIRDSPGHRRSSHRCQEFRSGLLAIVDCECRRERQGELGSRGSDHQALRPFHQEEEPQERELGESLSVIWVPISGLFAGAAVISRCPAQTERCRSGRSGRSRKPLSLLRGPRVRIPPSPPARHSLSSVPIRKMA